MIKLKVRKKTYYSDGPYMLLICDEDFVFFYQFNLTGYYFLGTSEDFIDGAHLGEIVPELNWSEMISEMVNRIVIETETDRMIFGLGIFLKSS